MNYYSMLTYISAFINVAVLYIIIKLHQKIKELEVITEEVEEEVKEVKKKIKKNKIKVKEELKEVEVEVKEEVKTVEVKEELKEVEVEVKEEIKTVEVKEEVKEVLKENDSNTYDSNTWYTFADNKARYKGEWKNGLPNGKGTKHSYKDDSYIYGNFVDGYTEGYGKQTFGQTWEKTQPYYEGEFKRNHFHGKGEYHYGDGDYYKGDWKDSKYNGKGAAYSKRLDSTWVGEYKNDEKVKDTGNWVRGEI